MLAFLGWNHGGERELYTLDELVPVFSLDRVIKSGARFNVEKAKWYNKEYLRAKSVPELADLFIPVLESHGVTGCPREYVESVVALVQERATFVADMWDIAQALFVAPSAYEQKDVDKFWKEDNYSLMVQAVDWLVKEYKGDATPEAIEPALVDYIRSKEWPMGKVMNCLRLALTGAASGLGIADIVARIGLDETARRVDAAVVTLAH